MSTCEEGYEELGRGAFLATLPQAYEKNYLPINFYRAIDGIFIGDVS